MVSQPTTSDPLADRWDSAGGVDYPGDLAFEAVFTRDVPVSSAPEPTSLWLVAADVGAMASRRRTT
jgi:hypothetical protein